MKNIEIIKESMSNDLLKINNKFESHPLFKNFFIRENNIFAPETECWRFSVPNNPDMEVSVIRSSITYGGDEGLYELAMTRNGRCIYDTPITNDVIGWLDEEGVLEILLKVENIYK